MAVNRAEWREGIHVDDPQRFEIKDFVVIVVGGSLVEDFLWVLKDKAVLVLKK